MLDERGPPGPLFSHLRGRYGRHRDGVVRLRPDVYRVRPRLRHRAEVARRRLRRGERHERHVLRRHALKGDGAFVRVPADGRIRSPGHCDALGGDRVYLLGYGFFKRIESALDGLVLHRVGAGCRKRSIYGDMVIDTHPCVPSRRGIAAIDRTCCVRPSGPRVEDRDAAQCLGGDRHRVHDADHASVGRLDDTFDVDALVECDAGHGLSYAGRRRRFKNVGTSIYDP